MATLNTAQKIPVTVTTSEGAPVGNKAVAFTVAGTAVIVQNQGLGDGTNFIIGQEPGAFTITATYQGQTGVLEGTVDPAPLVLTLGTPVAK